MRELRLHRGRVGALAWAGHTLATGGQDRRIVLSDLRAPDPAARLAGHRAEVCGLKVCRGAGSTNRACRSRACLVCQKLQQWICALWLRRTVPPDLRVLSCHGRGIL